MATKLALQKKEDFQKNHLIVLDAYTNYVEEHGKAPSITYLSQTTGLSRPTIYNHIKSMELSEVADKFKIRALTILEGIAKRAENGDVQAAKLMLSLAFGWNEKKILDVQQTNKTIQVTFTNPNKEQMQNISKTVIEDIEYSDDE